MTENNNYQIINTNALYTSIKNTKNIKDNADINNIKPSFIILPPLSLYIHFPWCEKKCPYCDFNSHDNTKIDEQNYITALEHDLIATLPLVWGRRINTVFIGGGTPSLISIAGMQRIMQILRNLLPMNYCQEITMEANPNSSESNKFEAFADCGINRISLGIQSFNDNHLHAIGRLHNSNQAKNAIDIAQKFFKRVNIDLMFALPQQNINQCQQDLTLAASFGTEHLSCYHFTIEPNTYFAKHTPHNIPNHDLASDMQNLVIEQTNQLGYKRYEISAYAKNSKHCQHNINYWQFGDYIGIGAGAHGKISSHDNIKRYVKHKHPSTYIKNALNLKDAQQGRHIANITEISSTELPFEYMLGALRLIDGVGINNFAATTGIGIEAILDKLELAYNKKLIINDNGKLVSTELGINFLNDLQIIFL